jgi:hypothetical protein
MCSHTLSLSRSLSLSLSLSLSAARAPSFSHAFDLSKATPTDQVDLKRVEMLNVQTINQSEKTSVYQALTAAISRAIGAHGR